MDGGEKVVATVTKHKIGASVKNEGAARVLISRREIKTGIRRVGGASHRRYPPRSIIFSPD